MSRRRPPYVRRSNVEADPDPADNPFPVIVPLFDAPLEPVAPARTRALKKHLIAMLKRLRGNKQLDNLVAPAPPMPDGFDGTVLAAACAHCRGYCCAGGGDDAFIDEAAVAGVLRDNPGLGPRGLLRRYLERVPPESQRGSCLFHGRNGCTLGRGLRSSLCDSYYCGGCRDFLDQWPRPDHVRVKAEGDGRSRTSTVLTRRVSPKVGH